MSNETAVFRQQQQAVTIATKAQAIDKIATDAMALFEGASSFAAELAVAQSIKDLRAALTPEIMEPVMALMNTDLGFLTDKDPRRPSYNKQTRQYEETKPYSVEVIRDVLIEAKLRGFHTIGNEFNVISRRFYAAKAGLKRRCETWPGVTDLKIVVGIPKLREGGAIVPVSGSWKKQQVADKIETEIAVRVNDQMGADAIVGKAERKLYKRIFDRLSGRVTPDGDVDDVKELAGAAPLPLPPAPPAPKVPPRQAPTPRSRTTTLVEQPLNPDERAEAAARLAPKPAPDAPAEGKGPQLTALQIMVSEIVAEAGASFDQFRKWGQSEFGDGAHDVLDWDAMAGFEDVPEKLAALLWRAKAGMIAGLKGGAQ